MKRKYKRHISLNERLGLIAVSALVPLTVLVFYLMYVLNMSNHAFDQITNSVTYANSYESEFKERLDYSMYLAVIRGEPVSELEEGKVTVNGIKIVNPYTYIGELKAACDEMADIATVNANKTRSMRIKRTLNSLEKWIRQIDDNLMESGKYTENMEMLDNNVYKLTELIDSAIQEYVIAETANFANVKEALLEQSARSQQLSLIVVCLVITLTVFLVILAFRSVARPIQELCDMSRQVAKGDFDTRVQTEAEDEISVLTESFNDMAAEIGQLVEDIKREQTNLRMMESKLLQAQINPHFLYNTLDTIVWLAEEKQTDNVVMMVTMLSEFFRTTLSKGKDYITVEEEKRHVDSYLRIQQFRYQDIMDYKIEIDKEILDYTIPKLTLQPLVENALYHGIKNKRGKGMITIQGYRSGNKVILKVIDNGKGMTEEELEKLRRYMVGYDNDSIKGFGVANVNQRIHHYYGDEYGVFFESVENEGTEAVIILPAKNIESES